MTASSLDIDAAVLGTRGLLDEERRRALLEKLVAEAGGLRRVLERQFAGASDPAVTPLTLGNGARLLEDGPAAFAAMLEAIRAARHHVNMEFFIFDERGKAARDFAAALGEKCRQGVCVNLIYDAIGSKDTAAKTFAGLSERGVRCLAVHPLNWFRSRGIRWTPFRRDHRKILIVDGRVAFTGGINIDEVYDEGASPRWRDTHLRLEGPVVGELQKLFLAQWQEQASGRLPDARFFPKPAEAGEQVVGIIATSPGDTGAAFHQALLGTIEAAERRVWVTQAYFAPPDALTQALQGAARRGVDVRLVLPRNSDQAAVVWAGRSHYAALLAAGARLFERRDVVLHSKTIVVDGVWSVVGSANFDYRSVRYNDEVNAIVLGGEFGAAMEQMFARDLAASVEVSAAAWAKRPLAARAKERLAHAVDAWL